MRRTPPQLSAAFLGMIYVPVKLPGLIVRCWKYRCLKSWAFESSSRPLFVNAKRSSVTFKSERVGNQNEGTQKLKERIFQHFRTKKKQKDTIVVATHEQMNLFSNSIFISAV